MMYAHLFHNCYITTYFLNSVNVIRRKKDDAFQILVQILGKLLPSLRLFPTKLCHNGIRARGSRGQI